LYRVPFPSSIIVDDLGYFRFATVQAIATGYSGRIAAAFAASSRQVHDDIARVSPLDIILIEFHD